MEKLPLISEEQALKRAMQICSRQEKCKNDIHQKLKMWNIEDSSAETIIENLVNENFIDEERFSIAFANDKYKFNKWGKQKIRFQLSAKKISDSHIYTALSEIDNELYFSIIEKEIITKHKNTKANSDWELKAKIMQFAQSRGYEIEIVEKILNKVLPID